MLASRSTLSTGACGKNRTAGDDIMKVTFQVPFQGFELHCDRIGAVGLPTFLMLHGSGHSTRERFTPLRSALMERGVASVAFDFIGHGETGGCFADSSLVARTGQAMAVIAAAGLQSPFWVLGSSMGGYNAVRLSKEVEVAGLALIAPAVYSPEAYEASFGPQFSELIKKPRSWEASDAWSIVSSFTGNVLIIAAEQDEVIPREIPTRLYEGARAASRRELFWLNNCSHFVMHHLQEFPEQCNAVAQRLLQLTEIFPQGE